MFTKSLLALVAAAALGLSMSAAQARDFDHRGGGHRGFEHSSHHGFSHHQRSEHRRHEERRFDRHDGRR